MSDLKNRSFIFPRLLTACGLALAACGGPSSALESRNFGRNNPTVDSNISIGATQLEKETRTSSALNSCCIDLPENHLEGFSFTHDTLPATSTFSGFDNEYSGSDTLSIFCFRGNARRSAPSRGSVPGKPVDVVQEWAFTTGYNSENIGGLGIWGGGAGWTGQPLLIHWTRAQKDSLKITDPTFLNDDQALEVVSGSLCGDIYFLNAATGKPTRKHLSIRQPIKGTVSVDPRKNGLLYVGQGIGGNGKFGAYVFDMFSGKEIMHLPGIDAFAPRKWGAFDSNPLIDLKTGAVFWPGENGLIYRFVTKNKKISEITRLRYAHPRMFRHGLEGSMAAFRNLGFFTDNSGTILCVDLRTMSPRWSADNFDDSDASILFESVGDSTGYVYTGSEIDKRAPADEAAIRKLDARNGDEVWRFSRKCYGTAINGRTNSGGILCSPVLGKRKGKGMVYTIFARINGNNNGELVGLDATTGKLRFSVVLDNYSWASPVDFYDQQGNIYLFLTDVYGTIYVVDGVTGQVLIRKKTGNTFESSPVMINDRIVLPARGRNILSYRIRV